MSPPPADPRDALRLEPDGLRLRVRLTPRAARDAVGAFERLADGNEVLVAHVRALPSEGAANAALGRLLAEALRVPKSHVEIAAGQTSRVKTVRIAGDAAGLAATLRALAATARK